MDGDFRVAILSIAVSKIIDRKHRANRLRHIFSKIQHPTARRFFNYLYVFLQVRRIFFQSSTPKQYNRKNSAKKTTRNFCQINL